MKLDHILHGGDYNPDQWIATPEIWDEDMRLMKQAGINAATVGIFSWSLLEPEEGKYEFGWLDAVFDKLYKNGQSVILATPSGARPPWMAQKYPEVLRVEETGIRNEYGVRHNHCLTSPVYREKVREINRRLAERYGKHPALLLWHVSNEYSGACHCELCQRAFRAWLKKEYRNDLNELNERWWNGFWSHRFTDWEQISSPKSRGENHVPALKLCWDRFVTDSHISFFENEIAPLRELTPDIPVTTNMMGFYDEINYQRFAGHVDVVSYDAYPPYDAADNKKTAAQFGFTYDAYRSMGGGGPFLLMESTPSVVNWRPVNKLPRPGRAAQAGLQAVAHGSDSVQYFQWRKSRGGHEKFHGAVVDHDGRGDHRVFLETAALGEKLKRLAPVAGSLCPAKVAVVYDWENARAVRHYNGLNNEYRDYLAECLKWYTPFFDRGFTVDVIGQEADLSPYALVIAPYLYMLLPGTAGRIRRYVENGGAFVATYLFGVADKDDRVFLGGLPGDGLREVFGVTARETDSLPEGVHGLMKYRGRTYRTARTCDILRSDGAAVLGVYTSDFYAGSPAVTVNRFGKGAAYTAAAGSEDEFTGHFCEDLIRKLKLKPEAGIETPPGVYARARGEYVFLMNFTDDRVSVKTGGGYLDLLSGGPAPETLALPVCGVAVLKKPDAPE